MVAPPPATSVYRTRSYVMRRRVLTGLAGVALLLAGYGIGRWQDSPSPAPAAALPSSSSVPGSPSTPSAAPTTSAPPKPTVYPTLQAESAALTGIQTQDTSDQGGGQNVGWISTGDSMRFDNLDFGPVPATRLLVRVAAGTDDGGRMEIHLDDAAQAAVGVLNVTSTGDWQTWRTDEVTLTSPVTGKHTVFFTFTGNKDSEFVNVNWLQFEH
ncbi:MAG TPA: carbohydrate-binding protein [Actinoplanes sp.]